jgi:hypothetical protein
VSVARREKSIFARRYAGTGFGVAVGTSMVAGGDGAGGGAAAPSGCVRLCSLKQGIEQLGCVGGVACGEGEAAY